MENNFNSRVEYAIAYIKNPSILKRANTQRKFDSCFEQYDGNYVIAALVRRAAKTKNFEDALFNFLGVDTWKKWIETANKFSHFSNKELKIEADEYRAKAIARSEAMERNWEEQERKAEALRESGSCKHPPARLYSGFSYSPEMGKDKMWVACCDCGEVLIGGAE
jgi:hypothetical protein